MRPLVQDGELVAKRQADCRIIFHDTDPVASSGLCVRPGRGEGEVHRESVVRVAFRPEAPPMRLDDRAAD